MRARVGDFIKRNRLPVTLVAIVVAVPLVLIAVGGILVVASSSEEGPWGTRGDRVASPTGEYEVVTYDWSAMIDPGWNLAIERVGTDEREWFWRSTEMPAPRSIRFTGPTTVEVTDDLGEVYAVDFDPKTLEPSDRFCPRPDYCRSAPWSSYTSEGP